MIKPGLTVCPVSDALFTVFTVLRRQLSLGLNYVAFDIIGIFLQRRLASFLFLMFA